MWQIPFNVYKYKTFQYENSAYTSIKSVKIYLYNRVHDDH